MPHVLSSLRGFAVALYLFVSAGNVTAAAEVPVESFAAQQTLQDPRISSNGSYLAVSADLGDDDHGPEIGAGWKRTGEKAGPFVAVQLDDPALATPIRANLFQLAGQPMQHVLVWNRPAKRDDKP